MQSTQPDRAFEVFVKRTLSAIQKESWGRSKEFKELRELCQNVLNLLHDYEQGHLQYDGSLAVAVLEPLYIACTSTNPKILDAALGCLHKLVAHAWLQGESSSGGQASDADVVSRVIRVVIRVGESSAVEGMQLAVIRALLTFTTAEHFVAHGDCLLAAVRMVFNLALGAEDDIIKRTASNALLQMLNTITKRVTAYQLYGGSSTATSRRSSLDGSMSQLASASVLQGSFGMAASERQLAGRLVEEQQATEAALAAAAAAAAERWVVSGQAQPSGQPSLSADPAAINSRFPSGVMLVPLSGAPSGALSEGPPVQRVPSEVSGSGIGASVDGGAGLARSSKGDGTGDSTGVDCRTAQLASLAEQRDLAGLEAALGAGTNLDDGLSAGEDEGPVVGRVRRHGHSSGGTAPRDVAPAATAAAAVVTSGGGAASAGAHSTGPSYSLRTSTVNRPHGFSQPSPSPPLPGAHRSPGGTSGSGHGAGGAAGGPQALWSPAAGSSLDASAASQQHQLDEQQPHSGALETAAAAGGPAAGEERPADSPFSGAGAAVANGAAAAGQHPSLQRSSLHSQRQLGHQQSHHSSHHHQHQTSLTVGPRAHGPRPLRTSERDVLLVLTAFCRLASREGGVTEVDKYLAAGKLLALELVVKVLQNPIHSWDNVRDDFVRHLHQPLCLVLLRNCSLSDPASFQLALRLLTAVLLQPKLRKGLKAEVGAFYPLLLLRPLEVEQLGGAELHPIASALPCLGSLCCETQLLVDLFVNYDCDLRAPNLYERTVQALSKLSQRMDLDGPAPTAAPKQLEQSRQLASVRESALRCLLGVVHCLDTWAGPLKDAGPQPSAAAAGGEARSAGQLEEPRESDGAGAATSGTLRANGGLDASEAERFEAAKVTKSSMSRGLALFNGGSPVKAVRFLIASGVIEDSPAGAAVFLRAHASDLDPAAMGEYLGHHEDFELAAMHAYVDQERYVGVTIDTALRSFLLPFRLPGEAQKIDRLMEAFAERYVRDNPGLFRNADAAYVLSFAVIMLNTDAHNPLAERRLDRAGFVAMTSLPAEDGGTAAGVYEPALPVRELEGIYDRIVAQEIVVRATPAGATAGAGGAGKGGRGWRGGNKLAAALGLRALVAPFRGGGVADRKQVSDVERQRQQMMEVAELAVARGGAAAAGVSSPLSTTWHACTHAAHTRPMLTVSGDALLTAMVAAVQRAPDAATAEAVLAGLVTLAQLAGLMGLEEQCEAAVAAVAEAASVAAPAPFGTAAAGRQLAALRALLGAVASPEAGQLGSAWTIILRTASELDGLMRVVTRPLQPGEVGVGFMSPPQAAAGGGGGGAEAGSKAQSTGGSSLLTKVFGGFWGGGGAAAASNGSGTGRGAGRKDSGGAGSLPPPPVRVMAGAATVMWAVTDGRNVIEQVYTRSATLDGEAVVVFVRALCAVSREELDATQPRVYSLQRLVEVAHLNLAGRIRLIWSKLWAVLSAHLVMAACHGQQPIAAQAVDALRGLAARVLEREQQQLARAGAGMAVRSASSGTMVGTGSHGQQQPGQHHQQQQPLAQSAWGASEGALRPFVAVLRLSDDPGVRAMALAAVAAVMTLHARGLGSGWRVAMEALRRASEDVAAAVYEQAVGALEVAVTALFRAAAPPLPAKHSAAGAAAAAAAAAAPPGHDCYRETLRAVLTAVRNPHHGDLAPAAVQLLVQVGDRLAARPPPQLQAVASGGIGGSGAASGLVSSYTSQHQHHRNWTASQPQSQSQPHPPALEPMSSGGSAATHGPLSPRTHRSLLDQLAAPPAPARGVTPHDDWALLLKVVADVAATPDAPRLAAAGLEASLDLMRSHSAAWGLRGWRVMLQRVVADVAFRVPPALDPAPHPAEAAAAAAAAAAGLPLESISASFVSRVDRLFPLMCCQLAPMAEAAVELDVEPPGRRRRASFDSDDVDAEEEGDLGGDGGGGSGLADLHRELLTLLAETCLTWFRYTAEPVARVGLVSLSRLLDATGGIVLPSLVSAPPRGGALGEDIRRQQQQLRCWEVLLPLVASTLDSEVALITQFAERLRRQQQDQQRPQLVVTAAGGGGGGPQGAAAGAVDGGVAAPLPLFSGVRPHVEPEVRRLRCRCRMLVLLQRTLSEYMARRVEQLPWSVTRQLVALLVGMAHRLMGFNMREELPPGLQHQEQRLTVAGGGEAAEGATGWLPVVTEGWGDGWGEGWEEDEGGAATSAAGGADAEEAAGRSPAGASEAVGSSGWDGTKAIEAEGSERRSLELAGRPNGASAGEATAAAAVAPPAVGEAKPHAAVSSSSTVAATAADPAAVTPLANGGGRSAGGAALPGARLHLPAAHLQLTSATSHDSMRPALARLEVEATDAAITLLLACAVPPPAAPEAFATSSPEASSSSASAEEQRREASEQLDSLCRHVVTCNVAAHSAPPALHHAASTSTPLEPAALDPGLPGSSWDHAVRAVVLARALLLLLHGVAEDALGAAGEKEREARRLALLPDVLVLLGSHQPVVRRAVADYLEQVLGPRLQIVALAE